MDHRPQTSFLTRQPLLDAEYRVLGHELGLRRNVPVPVIPGATSHTQMQDEWLLTRVADLDAQDALGGAFVLLSLDRSSLDNPFLEQMPGERLLVASRADGPAADLLANCRELARTGIRVVLDEADACPDYPLLAPYCPYVRLDTSGLDALSLGARVDRIRSAGQPQLIAGNVDCQEAYETCRKLSFSLFQGYHFTQLRPAEPSRLDGRRLRIMELLNLVAAQSDFRRIEEQFKLDAGLSYRLLRFINSPAVGLRLPIRSIGHTLTLLGHDQLYRWLSLLLFGHGSEDGRDQALLRSAVVRARFTENLGREHLPASQRGGLFIVGILSLLDALFNVPMQEALDGLNLPAPVGDALLRGTGVYAPFLELARACEGFDQDGVARIAAAAGLDADAVNLAHVEALIWSAGLDF